MKDRLISVLMPAYNHERYVEGAIRSVMAQDWPRVELVVVDDGSKDGTWKVLERLKPDLDARFERVVLEHQENRGTCVTCNRLREAARGDYVMILASDDEYLPGAFTALAAVLDADPSVGAAVGVNEIMDDEGVRCFWDADRGCVYAEADARFRTFDEFLGTETGVRAEDAAYGSYAELVRVNHIGNGVMFRRSVLDLIPPFTVDAPLEDWWLNLQLAKLARFVHIDTPTFRYRWHATNTIKQSARRLDTFRRTLLWEERSVEAMPDRRFRDAFAAAHWERRPKIALGRMLRLEKTITLESVRHVLTLFGHEFLLKEKKRNDR